VRASNACVSEYAISEAMFLYRDKCERRWWLLQVDLFQLICAIVLVLSVLSMVQQAMLNADELPPSLQLLLSNGQQNG
jgi:hypothetical protein